MGNVNRCCQSLNYTLGWGGVPDQERNTYFKEKLMCGWYELLCCPNAMGCTIVNFKQNDAQGGEPQYKVRSRLAYSQHVPRYCVNIVKNGKATSCVVGQMEKVETHLRAKDDEFIKVQIWKLTSNSMVWEERRTLLHRNSNSCSNAMKLRPTPSASDMVTMDMAITTQAKAEPNPNGKDKIQTWTQLIGLDSKAYKVSVEAPKGADKVHRSMKSMSSLRVLYRSRKVGNAMRQRFAGCHGDIEMPFLGLQIKPSEVSQDAGPKSLSSLLDSQGLMLMLMCLAWSEDTMTEDRDKTAEFVKAMMTNPGQPGSASYFGLDKQWVNDPIEPRVRQHPFVAFHNWNEEHPHEDEDEDEENMSDED